MHPTHIQEACIDVVRAGNSGYLNELYSRCVICWEVDVGWEEESVCEEGEGECV